MNAVSIDNQKRIIEKSNRSEPVVRTDLLLMKPDDFIYLCEKYDCNVTPYLISELGKTAAERSAFLLKDEAVETKSQIDVIASCQAVKSLVVSKIAEAYQWAREKNHISKDCDCSSANTYMSQAISNLEYMLMAELIQLQVENGNYIGRFMSCPRDFNAMCQACRCPM